jgi:hypothetical protein
MASMAAVDFGQRSTRLDRVESVRGNLGSATLSEIRHVLALILDID